MEMVYAGTPEPRVGPDLSNAVVKDLPALSGCVESLEDGHVVVEVELDVHGPARGAGMGELAVGPCLPRYRGMPIHKHGVLLGQECEHRDVRLVEAPHDRFWHCPARQ